MSEQAFKVKYPKGVIPRKSAEYGNTFVCRRGLNSKTLLYTKPIVWEDIAHRTTEEVHLLIDFLEKETQGTRKRKFAKAKPNDDIFAGGFVEEEEYSDADPTTTTPRKRRKNSNVPTPKKVRTPSKLLTPRHKR